MVSICIQCKSCSIEILSSCFTLFFIFFFFKGFGSWFHFQVNVDSLLSGEGCTKNLLCCKLAVAVWHAVSMVIAYVNRFATSGLKKNKTKKALLCFLILYIIDCRSHLSLFVLACLVSCSAQCILEYPCPEMLMVCGLSASVDRLWCEA